MLEELSLLLKVGTATGIQVIRCNSLAEAPLKIDEVRRAVLLSVISTPEQLREQLGFTHAIRPYIEDGNVVLMALNRLTHPDVPKVLKRMGYADVISYTAIRAAGLKSRLFVLFSEFEHPEVFSFDPFGRAPVWGPVLDVEPECEFIEPLTISEDCWLLRHPDDVRIVRSHWVIKLVGPGPVVGKWARMEASSQKSEEHSVWQWQPRNAQGELLAGEKGSWVFWGKRPQFEDLSWVFVSRSPRLTFYKDKMAAGDFFALGSDRRLHIAKNSEVALVKWPAIQASVLGDQKAAGSRQRAKVDHLSHFVLLNQIQNTLAPKKDLFSRAEAPQSRLNLLRELQGLNAKAQLWTPQQKIRFNSRLLESNPERNLLRLSLPKGRESEKLLKEYAADPTLKIFVNISLVRGGVFFLGEISEILKPQDEIQVRVPDSFYEVQRRQYFRLEPIRENPFYVSMGNRSLKIETLSAGGISLVSDAKDLELFAPGAVIEKIRFQINGRKIQCEAEVRWSKILETVPVETSLIVGIQFKGLKSADQQRLNLFVLEARFDYLKNLVAPALSD